MPWYVYKITYRQWKTLAGSEMTVDSAGGLSTYIVGACKFDAATRLKLSLPIHTIEIDTVALLCELDATEGLIVASQTKEIEAPVRAILLEGQA